MIYQELQSDTFTHNGKQYSVNKLLLITHEYPVESVRIKDLAWIIEFSKKHVNGKTVCLSCQGLGGQLHEVRVSRADISVPILITVHNDRFVILDGLHRLEKAIKLGFKKIPSKLVNEKKLEECRVT